MCVCAYSRRRWVVGQPGYWWLETRVRTPSPPPTARSINPPTHAVVAGEWVDSGGGGDGGGGGSDCGGGDDDGGGGDDGSGGNTEDAGAESVWRSEPSLQHIATLLLLLVRREHVAARWMGGPSSHLTADHTQTVAINISEKTMPSSVGGGGGGGAKSRGRRGGGFDSTDPTLNGDYRRPRRRIRKR